MEGDEPHKAVAKQDDQPDEDELGDIIEHDENSADNWAKKRCHLIREKLPDEDNKRKEPHVKEHAQLKVSYMLCVRFKVHQFLGRLGLEAESFVFLIDPIEMIVEDEPEQHNQKVVRRVVAQPQEWSLC